MVFGRLRNYFQTTSTVSPSASPATSFTLTIPSDTQEIPTVLDWLDTHYGLLHPEDLWKLKIVLSEWLTNVLLYAHRDLPATTPIQIHCQHQGNQLQIEVWDYGPPFDLTTQLQRQRQLLQSETQGDPLEALSDGGRGLFYIQTLTDQLRYYRTTSDPQQNCLQVQKKVRLR